MKRFLMLTLVAVLVWAVVPAFAQNDASLQYIMDKGTLVLGFDASFPPMGYSDENGVYVGFDLDVAKEVSKRLGVELVLQPIDWMAKDLELSSKNIDCIWNGMTITEDRAANMALSIPYLENAQVLCVKADSPYQNFDDLAGKTVSVQAASSGATALEADEAFRNSLGNVNEFQDYALALMDLDNGGCDAVAIDVIVANYYIAKKGADYRVLDQTLMPEQYAIGFRKGEKALSDKVDAILLEMASDGSLGLIAIDWFSEDITIVGK